MFEGPETSDKLVAVFFLPVRSARAALEFRFSRAEVYRMKFDAVGHSLAEKTMLTELLSSSGALQLSRYKDFLTHPCESERNEILDQAMEEALHRVTGNRIRGLSVRHVEGQVLISGQATSYQSRQLAIETVKSAIEGSGLHEYSARIDISVNDDHPDVAYAGCPAATIVVIPTSERHL